MEDYVKQALDIVRAQASVREMTADEMAEMFRKLTLGLRQVEEDFLGSAHNGREMITPDKAIRDKSIICLESGKAFKMLTKRHLAEYGLTPGEYRQKWGYPPDTPLVCKALRRERSKKMREIKLWERRIKDR